MTLIAGCFCLKGEPETDLCFQRLKAFPILLQETDGRYEYLLEAGPHAFMMAKYKPIKPFKLSWGRTENLSLLTLGFHDLRYPIDWADSLSAEQTAEKIQASEGEFTSVLMDRKDNRLFLINNRYWVRPLYYIQTAERFWFSSNLAFLLSMSGWKACPDPVGVLQIVCYGHTLVPQTHTQGVERLVPGSCLSVSSDGVKKELYWRLAYHPAEGLEPDAYSDEVFEAFRQSVERKVRRSPAGFITLSGGLDSRLTVGAAHGLCNYFALTFSNDTRQIDTPDVIVARQICQRLNIEHRVVQVSADEASAAADKIVRLTGGMQPMHHSLKGWQTVKVMAQTTRYSLSGGGGDTAAGDYINSLYQIEPDWTDTLIRLYAEQRRLFSKKELLRLFRREIVEEAFRPMKAAMVRSLREISGPTAAHKISGWAQVYFNSGFTCCGLGNHPDVFGTSPHLGYAYLEKMLRLPADWLYKKNFYQYMIYRCLPQLRDIVYANTGKPLSGRMECYRLSFRKKAARAIGKRLPFSLVSKLWVHPPILRSSMAGMFTEDRRLFADMREILAGSAAVRELFDPDGCLKFIDDYQAGRCTFGSIPIDDEMFGSLVSLFYWFKNTAG